MLLSARMLTNYRDANCFDYTTQSNWTEGDTVTLYFQLVDKTRDKPEGRRFIPATGASLSVVLESIDSAKEITRAASVVTTDRSIWYVNILATDVIRGTSNLKLVLNETGTYTRGSLAAAVGIYPANSCKTL